MKTLKKLEISCFFSSNYDMPFEKHNQVSEKRSKNTDFGAGDLVEISDAENHSDLGVLPKNF